MATSETVRWKAAPDEHDYPAAESYLSLIASDAVVRALVEALRGARQQFFHVKDVLRSARLELLPKDDPQVAADLTRVRRGKRMSPILLVRGDIRTGIPLQIADGYHRACASYHLSEDTMVACRLVDHPDPE